MAVKLQSLRTQYLDANGDPLSSGKLFFYEAGTTTKINTYSDAALSSANTNPIILDSAGRPSVEIFLAADDYKVVLAPSTDTDPPVAPVWTEDDYAVTSASSFSGGINASGETEHLTNAQTGTSYTIADGDRAKNVTFSNASAVAVTLPQANSSTFEDGWYFTATNKGAGLVTITPTTSTIAAMTVLTLGQGQSAKIISDGTNYQVAYYDSRPVNPQTGTSYTVVVGDRGRLVAHTNASAIAVTLPQAAATTFNSGWFYDTQNRGAGKVTITPTTSTIDGAATLTLDTNEGARIFSDGTNYFTQRGQGAAQGMTRLAKITATTASTIELVNGTSGVVLDSTYDAYYIFGELIFSSDGATLSLRVSDDGGSTFESGASYVYASNGLNDTASTLNASSAGATSMLLTPVGTGNDTGEGLAFNMTFFNPAGTTHHKKFLFATYNTASTAVTQHSNGGGAWEGSVVALDGLEFTPSAGTVTGFITICGYNIP
jgi:hypothetical protein